jgi:hypothetical protein
LSKYHTHFLLSVLLIVVSLFASTINNPPTSYLHSWNQVTTLVAIDDISKDVSTWNKPRDVVTRVERGTNSVRFQIFEEFPLYHSISAFLGNLLDNNEIAARIVSIFFYFLSAFYLYSLSESIYNKKSAWFALLIYLFSFPYLYYGQAIMSDMAMTSMLMGCCYYLDLWSKKGAPRYLILSAVLITFAGLFKSYAIIFTLLFVFEGMRNRRGSYLRFFTFSLLAVACSLPTLIWHFYGFLLPIYNETASHSLSTKISTIFSVELYRSFFKIYFRYLNTIPAILLIIGITISLTKGFKTLEKADLSLLKKWIFIAILFLLLVTDKLLHHDYYYLMFFPPIVIITGYYISLFYNYISVRYSSILCVFIISVFLAITGCEGFRHYDKATRNNPDVHACADAIQAHTSPQDLIGSLTDSSRYNALAYYSNRLAVNIEQDLLPLSRYTEVGARFLVINLPESDIVNFSSDFQNQLRDKDLLFENMELKDYKGNSRVCRVYDLNSMISN